MVTVLAETGIADETPGPIVLVTEPRSERLAGIGGRRWPACRRRAVSIGTTTCARQSGRRVGLAGFGAINRRYAELIAPFHCDVMVYNPFVDEAAMMQAGLQPIASLPELAARSEVFIVGIPRPRRRGRSSAARSSRHCRKARSW